MTLDDVLASYSAPGGLPTDEMQWALDHWKEASPRFTALLTAYARGDDRTSETADKLFIILHLQAEQCDAAVFPLLCQLLQEDEAALAIFGGSVGYTLPSMLLSLYDGDLPALASVVESEGANPFVRDATLSVMAHLTRIGQVPEDTMRAYLLRWLDQLQPQAEHQVWNAWVSVVAELGWADLTPQAEMLFEREFVDPAWLELEDFQNDMQIALERPAGLLGFGNEGIRPLGRAVDELKDYKNIQPGDSGQERDWTDEPEDDYLPPMIFTQGVGAYDREAVAYEHPGTITNPLRDVGRNDPCPCGSGKKYKKCCLV